MAKNKRYAENPLLYIHQPDVGTPNASMQSRYQTSRNQTDFQSNSREANNKIPKARVQRRYGGKLLRDKTEVENTSIKNDTPINPTEAIQQEQSSPKKFKEMDLAEKVKYLADEPNHAPKIKCEIKTMDKTYRGIIEDFDGVTVFMRVGKRVQSRKIFLDEIKRIRMLGF